MHFQSCRLNDLCRQPRICLLHSSRPPLTPSPMFWMVARVVGRRQTTETDYPIPLLVIPEHRRAGLNAETRALAEREGFEPSMSFTPYSLSRGAPSTTRPSLRMRKTRSKRQYLKHAARNFAFYAKQHMRLTLLRTMQLMPKL